ncbi:LOW QUALITY PROTEIN: hypothetical protein NP493_946g00001 [Ridgeia piscesae]|uniref:Uncharacterized protein n=1 Tax=Ridgeia piscesae TaxID=27915 RepID=A0AAD9NMJ2_RIDPI|nr:LOW QUALITY PROTEIN: hypothetical protein NP493_946g00001 [Ridgeia piscesae]
MLGIGLLLTCLQTAKTCSIATERLCTCTEPVLNCSSFCIS